MKSKPVYVPLAIDTTARCHLLIAQGDGGAALRPPGSTRVQVLRLDAPADLERELDAELQRAGMETAFYISGPEVFLWQVTRRLRQAGIENRRIHQELAGSRARTVYCVHCRALNEAVTANIHWCACCGTALTVRDHFSRLLGAYMGVVVDAEAPGDVPEPETLYA